MDFSQLKMILGRLGVDTENLKPFGNGHQVSICCPLSKWFHKSGTDSHPSMSIRFGIPGKWTVYKCWACKEAGKLHELIDSVGNLSGDPELNKLSLQLLDEDKPLLSVRLEQLEKELDEWVYDPAKEKPRSINADILERFTPAWEAVRTIDYLSRRDVTEEESWKHDLRYDDRQDRIMYPVYGREMQLHGAVGRIMRDTEPRYFNYFSLPASKVLGGIHRLHVECKRVLLVEGFFDLIRGSRYANAKGIDVVCSFHAEVSEDQVALLLSMDKAIICGYDNDPAGHEGWNKLKALLRGDYGVTRMLLPEGRDIGDCTEEMFKKALAKR